MVCHRNTWGVTGRATLVSNARDKSQMRMTEGEIKMSLAISLLLKYTCLEGQSTDLLKIKHTDLDS